MSHFMAARTVGKRSLQLCSKWNGSQIVSTSRRTFLTPAYACQDAWNSQRKECETLKHITPERYFFELNQKYAQKKKVSALDVDIYINSIYKGENQEELEHMIRRFRMTKRAIFSLDSTHHAVCRFYIRNGKVTRLLEILNNRLEYGVFPDQFAYNLILDASINEKNYDNAFETVKLMMLQEESGNDVTKILSFHALQKVYEDGLFGTFQRVEEVKAPKAEGEEGEEEAQEEAAAEEDDDEIEYVRVPFLTNPYFDDHFDLTDKVKIWGKSLYFFGHELAGKPLLSANAQIMGLVAFEKYDKLEKVLKKLGTVELVPEALELVEYKLKALEEPQGEEETPEKAEEKAKSIEAARNCLTKVKNLKASSVTLKSLCDDFLKEVGSHEAKDVQQQLELFKEFEKTRVDQIKEQLDRILHEQTAQEIAEKQKDLEQKKRLYYFFENFAKHEIDFVEAEKRIKEIQANTVVDEDYMPPEIR